MLFTKIKPTPTPVRESEPIVFVDVNPAQPTTEAPKNAKYYSSQNSRAANPEANRDTKIPQINGTANRNRQNRGRAAPGFFQTATGHAASAGTTGRRCDRKTPAI